MASVRGGIYIYSLFLEDGHRQMAFAVMEPLQLESHNSMSDVTEIHLLLVDKVTKTSMMIVVAKDGKRSILKMSII